MEITSATSAICARHRLTIHHGTLPRCWTISFAKSMRQRFVDSVGAIRIAEGASRIFSAEHDADVIHSSALTNPSMADACVWQKVVRVFYSGAYFGSHPRVSQGRW